MDIKKITKITKHMDYLKKRTSEKIFNCEYYFD